MERDKVLATQAELMKLGMEMERSKIEKKAKEIKINNTKTYLQEFIDKIDLLDTLKNKNIIEQKDFSFGKKHDYSKLVKLIEKYNFYLNHLESQNEKKYRQIGSLNEKVKDLEESAEDFIKDADESDEKNKKLKLRIYKLREKCKDKNKKIEFLSYFSIIASFLLFIQNYMLAFSILKYILYFSFNLIIKLPYNIIYHFVKFNIWLSINFPITFTWGYIVFFVLGYRIIVQYKRNKID